MVEQRLARPRLHLTKSARAAFEDGLGQKTPIFSPARPVPDDAQQNAQDDSRKALAPNGPSVLLLSIGERW